MQIKSSLIMFVLLSTLNIEAFADNNRLSIGSGGNDFQCGVNSGYKFRFFKQISSSDAKYLVNKEEFSSGELEYAWIVYLENDKRNIDFGFYYFKSSDLQKLISLEDLLQHGQTTLFIDKGEFSGSDPDLSKLITFQQDGADLVIEFNLSGVKSFSIEDYEFANFWVIAAGNMPLKCRASMDK